MFLSSRLSHPPWQADLNHNTSTTSFVRSRQACAPVLGDMLLLACLAAIGFAAITVLLMACLIVGSKADDDADFLLERLNRRSPHESAAPSEIRTAA
jgi:hypothetical protein